MDDPKTNLEEDPGSNPLERPKRVKVKSKTSDYTVMRLPEDEWLFAVVRKAKEHEKFTILPKEQEVATQTKIPTYDRIINIVSPFVNHLDGTAEPSCNCIHWMTRKTRCVHLKKFFEINPHLDPGEPKQPKVELPRPTETTNHGPKTPTTQNNHEK